jgi:hypothetical protein
MSKYLSWTNVASVWILVLIFGSLAFHDISEPRRMLLAIVIGTLVAYNVSDIISRYLYLKYKNGPRR